MINETINAQLSEWQARPLCCRYLSAHFDLLPMQVQEAGAAHCREAYWALGFLADGQCEILGSWLAPSSREMPWQEVFEDLKDRGVEKVRFIVVGGTAEVHRGMRASCPRASALPSVGRLLAQSLAQMTPRFRASVAPKLAALAAADTAQVAQSALDDVAAVRWGMKYPFIVERWRTLPEQLTSLYALSPRLRRVVLAGDAAVQQLHRSLSRAIERRGVFPNEQVAMSFLMHILGRVQRDLMARDLQAVARAPIRPVRPDSGLVLTASSAR